MIKKTKRKIIIPRSRVCSFCKSKTIPMWEDYEKLGEFLSPRSRILSSQLTGVCGRHQRKLATSIKQARHLALLPFITME